MRFFRRRRCDPLKVLPDELITPIFAILPSKDVVNSLLVSSRWHTKLLSNSALWIQRYNRNVPAIAYQDLKQYVRTQLARQIPVCIPFISTRLMQLNVYQWINLLGVQCNGMIDSLLIQFESQPNCEICFQHDDYFEQSFLDSLTSGFKFQGVRKLGFAVREMAHRQLMELVIMMPTLLQLSISCSIKIVGTEVALNTDRNLTGIFFRFKTVEDSRGVLDRMLAQLLSRCPKLIHLSIFGVPSLNRTCQQIPRKIRCLTIRDVEMAPDFFPPRRLISFQINPKTYPLRRALSIWSFANIETFVLRGQDAKVLNYYDIGERLRTLVVLDAQLARVVTKTLPGVRKLLLDTEPRALDEIISICPGLEELGLSYGLTDDFVYGIILQGRIRKLYGNTSLIGPFIRRLLDEKGIIVKPWIVAKLDVLNLDCEICKI
jgi:hypothetical protein